MDWKSKQKCPYLYSDNEITISFFIQKKKKKTILFPFKLLELNTQIISA